MRREQNKREDKESFICIDFSISSARVQTRFDASVRILFEDFIFSRGQGHLLQAPCGPSGPFPKNVHALLTSDSRDLGQRRYL
jgi:hypothetical protein